MKSNMANPILLFPLLLIGLLVIAIYVLVSSRDLSLPISLATELLVVLLPVMAAINMALTLIFQRMSQRMNSTIAFLAPNALHILQAVLTVVLATVTFEGILPGDLLNCSLHDTWLQLWKNHDGESIERIQNTFNCCGLNSPRDMSWPRQGTRVDLCGEMHHRFSSCVRPWTSAMQRNSGLDFGVAVAVGFIQLIHLVSFRMRNSSKPVGTNYQALPQRAEEDTDDVLLENGETSVTDTAISRHDVRQHNSYGSLGDRPRARIESNISGDAERGSRSKRVFRSS